MKFLKVSLNVKCAEFCYYLLNVQIYTCRIKRLDQCSGDMGYHWHGTWYVVSLGNAKGWPSNFRLGDVTHLIMKLVGYSPDSAIV